MMLDFPNMSAVVRQIRTVVPRFGARPMLVLACGVVTGWGGVSPAAYADTLPMRNLLVEWRVQGQDSARQSGGGVQGGQVVIDSQRGAWGQAHVTTRTWRTQSSDHSVQQVQVLNGGRARLFMGRSEPNTVWQWSGEVQPRTRPRGQGDVQWVAHTTWWELGQGLDVRPSWAGGQAPVVVELEASGSQRAQYDPDGQVRQTEVMSTLSVPLGEWVEVARSGMRQQVQQQGTWSSDRGAQVRTDRLEIRVSAP